MLNQTVFSLQWRLFTNKISSVERGKRTVALRSCHLFLGPQATLLGYADEEFVHITVNNQYTKIHWNHQINEVIRTSWKIFTIWENNNLKHQDSYSKKISKYVTQAWEATGRWIPCQLASVMIANHCKTLKLQFNGNTGCHPQSTFHESQNFRIKGSWMEVFIHSEPRRSGGNNTRTFAGIPILIWHFFHHITLHSSDRAGSMCQATSPAEMG